MAAEEYVGAAVIAQAIGVKPKTIGIYMSRYAGTDYPCPEPDVIVRGERDIPGWRADRIEEWVKWAKNRPGPGAGGGPPVRYRETERFTREVDEDGTVTIPDRTLLAGREYAGRLVTIVVEENQETGVHRWRVLVDGKEVKLIRPRSRPRRDEPDPK